MHRRALPTAPASAVRAPAALALALAVAAGCTAPKAEHDAGKESLRRDIVLATQLMGVADMAQAISRDELSRLVLTDATPEQVAYSARVHAGVANSLSGIALDPTPRAGLARMYLWCRIASAACANRVRLRPSAIVDNCDRVYGRIRGSVDAIAAREMTAGQRESLDAMAARYLAAHPDILNAGFLRIDDIAESREAAEFVIPESAASMLSPVEDATRQLELMRFLGTQLLWVATRAPESAGATVDAEVRLLLQTPEARAAVESAARIGAELQATRTSITELKEEHRRLAASLEALAGGIGSAAGQAERGITVLAWAAGAALLCVAAAAIAFLRAASRR